MNPVDGYGNESVHNCLLREVREETNLLDIYNEASAIEKKSLKGVFGKIKDALTELGSQPKM